MGANARQGESLPKRKTGWHCLPALWIAFLSVTSGDLHSQNALPAAPSKGAVQEAQKISPAEVKPSMPAAIPVADIAVQAEVALAYIRQADAADRLGKSAEMAERELPELIQSAAVRRVEMRRHLPRNASLDTIRTLTEEWREIETRASQVTRELTRDAAELDRHLGRLDEFSATWKATQAGAVAASAPPELIDRVNDVQREIRRARADALDRRAIVLGLQSRAAALAAQATEARQVLASAGERATARLLVPDSPPLWSGALRGEGPEAPAVEDGGLAAQWRAVVQTLSFQQPALFAHFGLFMLLASALFLTRRRVRLLCETETDLRRAARVFDMPVTSALLIALMMSSWFYERPPRLFWSMLGILGTVPTLIFLRRVIERRLYPVLYGLIGFYLIDKLRLLFTPAPPFGRLFFLGQSVLAVAFIVWLLRRAGSREGAFWPSSTSRQVVLLGSKAALILIAGAAAASVAGYVRLAELVGGVSLGSAYAAVVLYAVTRVGEGIVQALLRVPPLAALGVVRRHRNSLARRLNRWIKLAAALLWAGLVLRMVGMLDATWESLEKAWEATLTLGSLNVSFGELLTFVFVIWAAVAASRLIRFILNEEVYPKLHLERGLPYAVSTIIHYVVLVAGIVLALGAIGVDMTKFTILAGALTVGIGFGLQNIVNNFVSGLIVLFERPVKVGDTIQLDDITGRVERIGIRASTVHSTTGADVIIPNGKLISDKLINWTFSDRYRQISVPIVTKPDVDVGHVTSEMLALARQHGSILVHPEPEVLFTRRALDAFEFELRIWTELPDQWMRIRSELISAIDAALRPPASDDVQAAEDDPQLALDFEPVSPAPKRGRAVDR